MSIQPDHSLPSPQIGAPLLLVMLIIAIGLPSIASTILIPSLPIIRLDFQTDTASVAAIQTFYLIGLAVPQLVYGGVSDRIGRRPTILAGMGLFILGSLICVLAPSVEILTAGRLAQAVGGCAGIVLGRAILRDLFPRDKAAAYLAYITMVMTAGPMLAPVMGGLIQEQFGWRAIFVALTAVGVIALALSWRALPETNRPGLDLPRWSSLMMNFVTLLRLPAYRYYAIVPSCMTGAYQTFAATSTFVAAARFDIGPVEFGVGLLVIVATFSFGNFLSGRYARRIGIDRMIRVGAIINVVFALGLAATFVTDTLTPLTFFGMMALMNIGQGFGVTNAVTSATGAVPGLIGSAAGLTGFLQMATAAVFAMLVGALIEDFIWILPAVMLFLSVVGLWAALRAGRS